MANRSEPPMKAMAISFWIIVPLAIAVGLFVWALLGSSNLLLKLCGSVISFWIALRLLGLVSTVVMARVYKIPFDRRAEDDRVIELRAKAYKLIDELGFTGQDKTALIMKFMGGWGDNEMVEFLEDRVRENRRMGLKEMMEAMANFRRRTL